ncbi:MAG TPA: 5'-3' exonuclease [Actinomycetota bacterium]|nr:5'-3' exonuclease [Actinomycetota bacterium]
MTPSITPKRSRKRSDSLTLLVDASSLIFRAFFSTPDTVRAPDGSPINAAHGFLNMLARLIADRDPDFICCATDEDWRPEWRVELIDSYKSFRAVAGSAQEVAEDVIAPQMPVLFELLEGCQIPVVGHAGYEAEDVIGTLAARAPGRAAIVSGDRDLFQLVRDPDIVVLYPRKGVSQMDEVNEGYIEQKYGIPGRAYRDFAVLRGDPSDGLPGVRGIGEKSATALIARHGNLEGVIKAAEDPTANTLLGKVRQDLDYVRRAVKVVTIPTDLPIAKIDLTRPRKEPDPPVYALADRFALGGALRRLIAAYTGKTQPAQ